MAFFRNLCVKLRASLCGVQQYAFSQPLFSLILRKNSHFWIGNTTWCHPCCMDGH